MRSSLFVMPAGKIVPTQRELRPEAIAKLRGQNGADETAHYGRHPPPIRGVMEADRKQKSQQNAKEKPKSESNPEFQSTSRRVGEAKGRIRSCIGIYHRDL